MNIYVCKSTKNSMTDFLADLQCKKITLFEEKISFR